MIKRALVLFFCFLGAAVLFARADRAERVPVRTPLTLLPMQFDDWQGEPIPALDAKVVAVLGATEILNRVYYSPAGRSVGLYVAYYESQRQGDSIHSPLNCLPGSGWQPLAQSTLKVEVSGGAATSPIVINRYLVQKGLDRQLILYWYQSHGRVIANEYVGRFYLIRDALQMNRTDASLVRVAAPIPTGATGQAASETMAVRFIQVMFPRLSAYLPA
jgi:EpsI family protein